MIDMSLPSLSTFQSVQSARVRWSFNFRWRKEESIFLPKNQIVLPKSQIFLPKSQIFMSKRHIFLPKSWTFNSKELKVGKQTTSKLMSCIPQLLALIGFKSNKKPGAFNINYSEIKRAPASLKCWLFTSTKFAQSSKYIGMLKRAFTYRPNDPFLAQAHLRLRQHKPFATAFPILLMAYV